LSNPLPEVLKLFKQFFNQNRVFLVNLVKALAEVKFGGSDKMEKVRRKIGRTSLLFRKF